MAGLRLAFMGSPDLGVPCLRALRDAEDLDLLCAITLPDRRRGRRGRPEPTAIGRAALELDLPLLRWERGGRESVERELAGLDLDAIVVIAFARILRPSTLSLPRLGCLNLHASLLPWGRGASPIQETILRGLRVTGWSALLMDEGLDTGPVLGSEELSVGERWTSGELSAALQSGAPAFLLRTLRAWRDGQLQPQNQDESAATMTRRIPADAGAIDWSLPTAELDARIRAYDPAPGSWCRREGERLGVHAAKPAEAWEEARPGEVRAGGRRLCVACGEGALELVRLQPPGKRPMAAADYLNGRPFSPGAVLENG